MFRKMQRGRGAIHTLIGDGTEITGDLRFTGGCHIDGVVHGSVIADKDPDAFLTISENGFVEGSVRVPTVSLNGKVQGDVHASEAVTLGPTAKVIGNVHYELLEMTSGAEINGKLIHVNSVRPVPASPPLKPAAAAEQPRAVSGTPVKQT